MSPFPFTRQMVATIVIGLSSLGFLIALLVGVYQFKFNDTANRASGQVIDVVTKEDRKGYFYPVFTFQTSQGRNVTVVASFGSYPPSYSKGDKITVLFDPNMPEKARIDDFISTWGACLVVAFISSFWMTVGLLVWWGPTLLSRFTKTQS